MLFQLFWIAVSVVSRETAREMSALGLKAGALPPALGAVAPAVGAGVFCAWARGVSMSAAAAAAGSISQCKRRSDEAREVAEVAEVLEVLKRWEVPVA